MLHRKLQLLSMRSHDWLLGAVPNDGASGAVPVVVRSERLRHLPSVFACRTHTA